MNYSHSYVTKLIQILNRWGSFLSKKRNCYFSPIPYPRGGDRAKIEDNYHLNTRKTKESTPLTSSLLEKKKSEFQKICHFNWLTISLWFGLRPVEVDSLLKGECVNYQIEEIDGETVLKVYQSKLTSLPFDQRWKLIPVLYPEQREALALIKKQDFKRPMIKTIKRVLGEKYTTYGGRKGFEQLLHSKGVSFEAISSYLGHSSVERTWNSYRNKKRVILK